MCLRRLNDLSFPNVCIGNPGTNDFVYFQSHPAVVEQQVDNDKQL